MCGVMTGAKIAATIAATGGKTGVMIAVTDGMTAAIGVPAPGCCGDSSMCARTSKAPTPTPLSRATRVRGSVTW
jgi:hypothetical protein